MPRRALALKWSWFLGATCCLDFVRVGLAWGNSPGLGVFLDCRWACVPELSGSDSCAHSLILESNASFIHLVTGPFSKQHLLCSDTVVSSSGCKTEYNPILAPTELRVLWQEQTSKQTECHVIVTFILMKCYSNLPWGKKEGVWWWGGLFISSSVLLCHVLELVVSPPD